MDQFTSFCGKFRAQWRSCATGAGGRISMTRRNWYCQITSTCALLGLALVVACGGTVRVEPGAAGAGAPGAESGGSGGVTAPSSAAGSANSGHAGSSPGGAGSSMSGAGEAGTAGDAGAPGTCVFEGVEYAIGQRFACDCNTCWCEADGSVSGTDVGCGDCYYAGQGYFIGEKFPDRDGCNQCECADTGLVSCTEAYCGCHPSRESYRDYVATSCELIDYECPSNTVAFSNECGCGCEQGARCPEQVQCFPGDDACEPWRELCPYSELSL